jgi:DNA polymerase-3 subunit chi
VADKQEGEMFDKLLWTWKQASFIPHKYIDQLSTPLEEPVVITPQIAATADYDALVLAAPADKEVTDRFPVILDFADKFDQARLLESRERYRLYRSYQYQLVDMQPGEFFAAVLK